MGLQSNIQRYANPFLSSNIIVLSTTKSRLNPIKSDTKQNQRDDRKGSDAELTGTHPF